jgi:hypothetical protein
MAKRFIRPCRPRAQKSNAEREIVVVGSLLARDYAFVQLSVPFSAGSEFISFSLSVCVQGLFVSLLAMVLAIGIVVDDHRRGGERGARHGRLASSC